MSNNVTRKGLAFGALVALTSTAIAGAPAMAAGEINFAASAGTSYTTIASEAFVLEAAMAPGFIPADPSQLKYAVTTDGSNVKAATATTAAGALTAVGSASNLTLTSNTGVVTQTRANNTVRSFVAVTPAATTDTESITVTAFVDANNDGAVTAGEWTAARTLTFKKLADVTATLDLSQPATGDTTATGTLALTDINLDQVQSAVTLAFDNGASTPAALAPATSGANGDLAFQGLATTVSSGKYTATTAALTAFTSSTVVRLTAKIGANSVGTAVSKTATARSISSLTASVDASDNSKASTGSSSPYAADVRIDGAWIAKAKAMDTASTPAAAANVAVKATVSVTGATLAAATSSASEVSITVAGTKYTSATDLGNASFPVTTGTDGFATLAISTSGFANGNSVTVTFSAQNLSSVVTATSRTLAYTVTEANTATTRATLKNTPVQVAYTVKDQFGVKSAATNQRLVISATNSTTLSSAAQYVAVAAGVASATITPITDSTAAMVITADLQDSTYSTSTGATTWAASAGATDAADITVNIASGAFDFTSAPALTGVAGAAYSASAPTKQVVTQAALADLAASAGANGNATWAAITLTGNTVGAEVKVAGTGIFISTAAGVTAVVDSATLYATGASQVVYVASNTVGTKTVTFTTGAVSKTVDVVFTSGAASTGAVINVAVAAAAQAGRSIDATATVTDKFGNPVANFNVTATVAGVASVNGGFSANVTTDANGKATVKLTAGINDLGDAVVTFSDKGDNSVPTTAAVTAVAKTVVFGQTDGYIDILNEKRASVTWSMAKGKRVAFYLDGVRKYNFVQTGDAELNLQFNLKKGTHNIKLVIGGQIVDDITVKITK